MIVLNTKPQQCEDYNVVGYASIVKVIILRIVPTLIPDYTASYSHP
jgi:hypothetical protein